MLTVGNVRCLFFTMFKGLYFLFFAVIFWSGARAQDSYTDMVNCSAGGISHMLMPTRATVQLPHSMMRFWPQKDDAAAFVIKGLPLFSPSHRFNADNLLHVYVSDSQPKRYFFDGEVLRPNKYEVFLCDEGVLASYAPSFRSAVCKFDFAKAKDAPRKVSVALRNPALDFLTGKNFMGICQSLDNSTRVYIYIEFDSTPVAIEKSADGRAVTAQFGAGLKLLRAKYAVSFISFERAQASLQKEIPDFDFAKVQEDGARIWNETLGQIEVETPDENLRKVFYTSFWRTFERMVNYDEYGEYWNAYAGKAMPSINGKYFYCDDWSWDTYRAFHPLKLLLEPETELLCLQSYLEAARGSRQGWMPKFPTVSGDLPYMNGNHIAASFWDAVSKGYDVPNLEESYKYLKNTVETKSLMPDTFGAAGEISAFYKENGFIPALKPDQPETSKEVNSHMKRQCVSVTLACAFDDWALAQIAKHLGNMADYEKYSARALNYRKLFNAETGFFHPKDADGNFIEPFDYAQSGGQAFRDYYTENNAWIYRWDAEHATDDLILLMGGAAAAEKNLDDMFANSLPKPKYSYYRSAPDHTGNVGLYSMANEPAMRIPYLYCFAGKPWKTQRAVRMLLDTWFRNDLMGIPGDEDGGAFGAFAVFSQLGFYPVNVGGGAYVIGTPFFERARIKLKNGAVIEIKAPGASSKNKYVKSLKINGEIRNSFLLPHEKIADGALLEFEMSDAPNPDWGTGLPRGE